MEDYNPHTCCWLCGNPRFEFIDVHTKYAYGENAVCSDCLGLHPNGEIKFPYKHKQCRIFIDKLVSINDLKKIREQFFNQFIIWYDRLVNPKTEYEVCMRKERDVRNLNLVK